VSARNTGLFVAGHIQDEAVAAALAQWPGFQPAHFAGAEGPRVGRSSRHGLPYTHVALRLFEVAGLRLLDDDEPPPADDLECVLGQALSAGGGRAVFAFYDEEQAAGGAAVFVDGQRVSRCCFDARDTAPVRRDDEGTTRLRDLDASDWIWVPASDTIEAALEPVVGPGVRTDDELEALIEGAEARPISLVAPSPAPSAPEAPRERKRDRLKGALRRLWDR
jgi:hypothetical protein